MISGMKERKKNKRVKIIMNVMGYKIRTEFIKKIHKKTKQTNKQNN